MSKLCAPSGLTGPSPALQSLFLCSLGFGLAQTELQLGGALSTIFSAPPYSLDSHRLAWLLGAVYAGGCICTPLLGRAADRYGVGRLLRWTVLWLGATSALAGLRDDPAWLSVFRLLMGISLGAYPPLVIAYLTSIAPEGQRGRWVFWACGLSYIAAPVSLFALRSLTAWHPGGLAGWRWLSFGIGLVAMITGYLFRSLPEPGRTQAKDPGFSQRAALSMLIRTPLRRTFALVALLYFLYPWGTAAFVVVTGPVLLQRGFTVSSALWYVAFATVWPVVGTLAAAWVVDRISRQTAIVACCVTMLIAALCFVTGDSAFSTSAALVAFGVAQALYPAVLTTFGAESFPHDIRATATSTAWALNRVASLLVPWAMLPLLKSSSPLSVGMCVAGALILSAALSLGASSAHVRKHAPDELVA